MKPMMFALIAVTSVLVAAPAFAGPCTYTTDTAADGSRCGDRASTVRPGGK